MASGHYLIDLTETTRTGEESSSIVVIQDSNEDEDRKPAALPEKRGTICLCSDEEQQTPSSQLSKKRRSSGRRRFDCPICIEDSILWRDGIHVTECNHSFCKECLRGFVLSKLSDRVHHRLICPSPKCETALSPENVRACTLLLGDRKSWGEYEELATQSFLDRAASADDQPFIRRCPAERCNFTFHFEPTDGQGQLFICPQCNEAFCLNCPVVGGNVGPGHNGSCHAKLEEIRRSEEEKRKLDAWKLLNSQADERFNELLRAERSSGITKPCPNCKTYITKNQGCNHMRCTRCGHDYSWSSA